MIPSIKEYLLPEGSTLFRLTQGVLVYINSQGLAIRLTPEQELFVKLQSIAKEQGVEVLQALVDHIQKELSA